MSDHGAVIWLSDPQARQPALVGGKVATLARFADDYNVPPGFCVSVPSAAVRDARSSAKSPDALHADLAAAYARLSERCGTEDLPVAVRSSAAEEDGRQFSFAGQHKTFLNVRGLGAVIGAVAQCLASASSPGVHRYRAGHGLEDARSRFTVLVQQLISADAAVVAFSVNPVTGAQEVVLNANWGLGESVVSGLVTPDAFVVSKLGRRIVSRQIAVKESMTVPARKGTKQTAVPDDLRRGPSLGRTDFGNRRAVSRARGGARLPHRRRVLLQKRRFVPAPVPPGHGAPVGAARLRFSALVRRRVDPHRAPHLVVDKPGDRLDGSVEIAAPVGKVARVV